MEMPFYQQPEKPEWMKRYSLNPARGHSLKSWIVISILNSIDVVFFSYRNLSIYSLRLSVAAQL
ncbi:Uncharacterised protein [Yersinia pseudotuberculosis]|nr:Uncharacterised protein [Yersinia pseudotuberculosis]SUP88634.1 Uncharacterised protein [Yersinia pseudotuberculosis]